MRRARPTGAIPLLALLLLGLVGAGVGGVRAAEGRARRDIEARLPPLGPDRPTRRVRLRMTYPGLVSPAIGEIEEARIEASNFRVAGLPFVREPERSARGRIVRLVVELSDFELSGLPVERLEVTVPECRFDLGYAARTGRIRISRAGTGTARVVLRPEEIAIWLMRRSPSLTRVTARIEEGRLRVEGRIGFRGFVVPFDVRTELAADGPRLLMRIPEIRLGGTTVGAEATAALSRLLNPVVDADRDLGLRGAILAERATIEGGRIVIVGRATIPTAPQTKERGGIGVPIPPR